MPRPEIPKNSGDFFRENPKAVSLRREFGLVKVDSRWGRGLSNLAHISEFDGWAIEKESFLGRWLEFAPVRRLRGVHQLGLNRCFPLPNNHTRFDHSAEVALRTTLVLSRLARDFQEEFLALSQSYPLNLNPQLSGKERENEQIVKTIKLGAIYAASHDIATPAGGDGIKYIVGLDDDRDFPMVLSCRREDFTRLCQEDGFNPEDVAELFVQLAQRKEKGILGQLIHCSGGDSGREDRGFDLDSICYTLMDAQSCLGLSRRQQDSRSPEVIPQEGFVIQTELERTGSYLDKQQGELNQRALGWLRAHEGELRQCYQYDLPYPYIDFPLFRPQRPPQSLNMEDFSCFNSLALQDGKVVLTDPQKLNNLFLLADFLARYVYFSPACLGPELSLAANIEFEREKTSFSEKEKHYLLTVDDHSFLENLKENSPNWVYWFSDLASLGWEGSNLARGNNRQISFRETSPFGIEQDYLNKLLTIKKIPSRLATLLLASGEIKVLEEVFPQSRERIKKAGRTAGFLTDAFPRWTRPPFSWIFADEYLRPERYQIEKQSF